MNLLNRHRAEREAARYGLTDLVQWKISGDARFPVTTNIAGRPVENISCDFGSYVTEIAKKNSTVANCLNIRASIFAEVRFRFARLEEGRVGRMFGSPELALLETPFGPNTTTGELAFRMIQDADCGGNFYAVRRDGRLWRRRPDKVVIVLDGDPTEDEFVAVAGYAYYPKGVQAGGDFHTYLPEEMAHWSPLPDPEADYKGMSWMTPILREIRSDGAATDHKLEFFANAATPSMVVKTPESVMTREQFEKFREDMNRTHVGGGNRHKTLFLVPGSDVTVVGRDFEQMQFSEVQGRDEDRIAAAAGVPAVIAGLKESLQGSSLNSGNFSQARRRLADVTMRPLYRSASAALSQVVNVPQSKGPAVLWYDADGVAFFREDRKDAAEIQNVKAQMIRTLTDGGYTPESIIAAVEAENMGLLVHTGMVPVQLQPPGAQSNSLRVERDESGRIVRLDDGRRRLSVVRDEYDRPERLETA